MDALVRDMHFFTVAHEVAHQYFAGLVGADVRRDAGLDEPLAQFAAGEVAREARGERAGDQLTDSQVKLNYGIYRLIGGEDRPVAQPVRAFGSPLAYAAIVYGKAPYFYRALRRQLGSAAFDRALRATVDAHRFQVVTLDQWLATLDARCGGRARALARRWFHERHGDEDLGIDDSGEQVMASLLGKQTVEQLRQGLGMLGMQPRDLFRMLMGHLLREEGQPGPDLDPQKALEELHRLFK
jgi:aminopeptidase N